MEHYQSFPLIVLLGGTTLHEAVSHNSALGVLEILVLGLLRVVDAADLWALFQVPDVGKRVHALLTLLHLVWRYELAVLEGLHIGFPEDASWLNLGLAHVDVERVEGEKDALVEDHGAVAVRHADRAARGLQVEDRGARDVLRLKVGLAVEPNTGTHAEYESPSYQRSHESIDRATTSPARSTAVRAPWRRRRRPHGRVRELVLVLLPLVLLQSSSSSCVFSPAAAPIRIPLVTRRCNSRAA